MVTKGNLPAYLRYHGVSIDLRHVERWLALDAAEKWWREGLFGGKEGLSEGGGLEGLLEEDVRMALGPLFGGGDMQKCLD